MDIILFGANNERKTSPVAAVMGDPECALPRPRGSQSSIFAVCGSSRGCLKVPKKHLANYVFVTFQKISGLRAFGVAELCNRAAPNDNFIVIRVACRLSTTSIYYTCS